jgi:transcriptional regulator with XRE-family HTH domain
VAQEALELTPAQQMGELIHQYRRRKKWTQLQLAREATTYGIRIGNNTVSRIEIGDRLPTWNELLAISLALGTDPVSLGAREEDYPELRLTRKLIERIR